MTMEQLAPFLSENDRPTWGKCRNYLTVTLFGGHFDSLPTMPRATDFAANYHDNDAYSTVPPDSASHHRLWLSRDATA
jgi:hypothetical protein